MISANTEPAFFVWTVNGVLESLEAASGKINWQYQGYAGKATYPDAANSINIIKNNMIYFSLIKTEVVAIDISDGTQKWKVPVKDGFFVRTISVNSNNVVVEAQSSTEYIVYRIDSQTGKTDVLSVNPPFSGIIRIDEDYIYTSQGVFELTTLKKRWDWPFQNSAVFRINDMTDRSWYIVIPNETSMIYAYDLKTGQNRWSFTAPPYIKYVPSRSFWYDEAEKMLTVLIIDGIDVSREKLIGVDAGTGVQKWEYKVGVSSSPIIQNNATRLVGPNMLVHTIQYSPSTQYKNRLTAIDMNTGIRKWEIENNGLQFLGGNNDLVLLVENNKTLKAISQTTGLVIWQNEKLSTASDGFRFIGDNLFLRKGSEGIILDAKTGAQKWSISEVLTPFNGKTFLNN